MAGTWSLFDLSNLGQGLLGGGFLNTNVANTKTYSTQNNIQNTTNRSYDVQYNFASGGSNITTKKESAVSQAPTQSPQVLQIPSLSQGASIPSGSGGSGASSNPFSVLTDNITGVAIVGVIGFVAYKFLSKGKK